MPVYKPLTRTLLELGIMGDIDLGEFVFKHVLIGLLCLVGSCWAQQEIWVSPLPVESDVRPVPVLSGGLAFVPTWDGGNPTLLSIVSPVLLVPLGDNLLVESRAAFEGDFPAAGRQLR